MALAPDAPSAPLPAPALAQQSNVANDRRYYVGVRAFCAFVAKTGDLDLRFTPAPTAEEGIAGHAAVAARRGSDYRREVPVSGCIDGLWLRGRIDGLIPEPLVLEEIKTCRGGPERITPAQRALHWAQLKTYGALYCAAESLDQITLRLVAFDIDARTEHEDVAVCTATELHAFVGAYATRYRAWMQQQRRHRRRRDRTLAAIGFPHAQVHEGQALLMAASAEALTQAKDLLVQAPTGVGKTIGTLFPALKALAAGKLDRVFYLTAKTSGRAEALKALASLHAQNPEPMPLRVLELTAREKACEHPDKACFGDACPLARGFFDRLPAARAQAQDAGHLGPLALRDIALQHQVCPYYLAQEMVRWSDVVIGDVNYYFDQHALLHAMRQENDWRVAVLVDEAHNLIDRARAMYSATLSQSALREVHATAPGELREPLGQVDRALCDLVDLLPAGTQPEAPPPALRDALTRAVAACGGYLGEDLARRESRLLALYFDLLAFQRLAEDFDTHALLELATTANPNSLLTESLAELTVRNVVPARYLRPRLQAASSVIAFSATLNPPAYHRAMLGFADDAPWCDAPTPFAREQLRVRVVPGISTRPDDRHASARPIARVIARQYHRRPGNYLAFFSSFAYLQLVADAFGHHAPDIAMSRQAPGMSEAARAAFLARFTPDSCGVGFAVLGGTFAEGIDLPGDRLVGAFIATLGLPQYNAANRRMAERVETQFGAGNGNRFVFLYPGLQKVVQAAGRVVRGPKDTGVVMLIDARYARPEVRALLPAWWRSE